MKTKIILSIVAIAMMAPTYGQIQTLELTFTAIDSGAYVKLDSVKVMNRSQGGDEVVYWPDTTLMIDINPGDTLLYIGYLTGLPVGIQEVNQELEKFQVFQNYPNPVKDQCVVSMTIPEKGTVTLMVADMLGRNIIDATWMLDKGYHSFRFSPGNGNLFFLTAQYNGISRSIKIPTIESGSGNRCSLKYIGSDNMDPQLNVRNVMQRSLIESGMLDTPDTNATYTFQFATNIPCPGTRTVTYEGQVYNTIQIFSQCWLKENLNVGTMISVKTNQTNNNIIEKYCYNNDANQCNTYGGLYQWNETMQYSAQQGVQGICPQGWHIPTDEEWKVLEGAVDSQYGIGDTEWDLTSDRGHDAGTNLKSTSGWYSGGNGTNMFGFSGLPSGYSYYNTFYQMYYNGYWWTSTEDYYYPVWEYSLSYSSPRVCRWSFYSESGNSVRCLKNY